MILPPMTVLLASTAFKDLQEMFLNQILLENNVFLVNSVQLDHPQLQPVQQESIVRNTSKML